MAELAEDDGKSDTFGAGSGSSHPAKTVNVNTLLDAGRGSGASLKAGAPPHSMPRKGH